MNQQDFPEFDWPAAAVEAAAQFGTPCYLFSWKIVLHALHVLNAVKGEIRIRHWLSLKSQPLRRLVQESRSLNAGIEVVSEFELRAALSEGFSPEDVLVNGVGKHHWIADFAVSRIEGALRFPRRNKQVGKNSRPPRLASRLAFCAQKTSGSR